MTATATPKNDGPAGQDPLTKGGRPPNSRRDPAQAAREKRPMTPPAAYELRTRKPTGKLGGCLILVEGDEYSRKTFTALGLSLDPRVGQVYMLPLGSAEEMDAYSAAGFRYDIIEHGGTRAELVDVVQALRRKAFAAKAAGQPPIVNIIDSGTWLWRMLSRYANHLARTSWAAKRKLQQDPNANIPTTALHWDAANKWHEDFVSLLVSAPMITIITARGREVAVFNEDGSTAKDDNNQAIRGYKVNAQKDLGFASTAWVRLTRGEHPQIIGMRLPNPKHSIMPYDKGDAVVLDPEAPRFKDKGITFDQSWLGWLVFDVLGVDPRQMEPRASAELHADAEPPVEPAGPATAPPVDGADEAPGQVPDADVLEPNRGGR